MTARKVKPLGAVEDAEQELSTARLKLEEIEAAITRGEASPDDLAAVERLIKWAELRLDGAHEAQVVAGKVAGTAASAGHRDELRDGRHPERAARLVDRYAAARAALVELYAEAREYTADTDRHITALARAEHLPDDVEIERNAQGRPAGVRCGDAVWQRTPRLADDLVAAVAVDLDRGADHQPAAVEPLWATLRAAHTDLDVTTPELDRRRVERAEQRRQERAIAENRRRRTAQREAVRQAHAAARAGDFRGIDLAVRSGHWPPGEPYPDGYTPPGDAA